MKTRLSQGWAIAASVALTFVLAYAPDGGGAPLGNGSFAAGSASDLINPQRLPGAARSLGFAMRVGGVAFGASAEPARSGLFLRGLEYRPERADGARLVARVEDNGQGKNVTVRAYDWQLIPVAHYVASGQHAAMTLFGTMRDAQDTEWMHSHGYQIINVEHALRDTLLGLRLFHADTLILSEAAADLPRTSAGYVLGAGEQPPQVQANRNALAALRQAIASFGTQPFQSYIITDLGGGVRYDIQGDQLAFTGYPIWHCWRQPALSADQRAGVVDDAVRLANAQLNEEMEADFETMSPAQFSSKYTDEYQQARFEQLADDYLSEQLLIPLPALSDAISSHLAQHGGVNPAVYAALTQTMHLAALYRNWRAVAPGAYAELLGVMSRVPRNPCLAIPAGYVAGAPLLLPDSLLFGAEACAVAASDAGIDAAPSVGVDAATDGAGASADSRVDASVTGAPTRDGAFVDGKDASDDGPSINPPRDSGAAVAIGVDAEAEAGASTHSAPTDTAPNAGARADTTAMPEPPDRQLPPMPPDATKPMMPLATTGDPATADDVNARSNGCTCRVGGGRASSAPGASIGLLLCALLMWRRDRRRRRK